MDSIDGPSKREYSRPIFRKLNREQATLFLLGHAWDGDLKAKALLELVFPDPSAEHSKPLKTRSLKTKYTGSAKFDLPVTPALSHS